MTSKTGFKHWLFVAAGCYLTILYVLSFNFPYWDDFSLLRYVTKLQKQEINWLEYLLIKHVDHYIVLPKVVAGFSAQVLGKVNFVAMPLIGNLALFGTFYFYKRALEEELAIEFSASTSLALFASIFTFANSEATFTSVTSLQMFWSNFIAAAVLFHFCHRRLSVASTIALAPVMFVGMFNQGNMFVIPALSIAAIALRKQWRIVALQALLTGGMYFLAARAGYFHKDISIVDALQHTPRIALFFLTFLGGTFGLYTGSKLEIANQAFTCIALAAGIGLLMRFAWLTYQQAWRQKPFLYLMALFMLVTAALISIGRYAEAGIAYAMSSRYHQYSMFLCICLLPELITQSPRIYSWVRNHPRVVAASFVGLIAFGNVFVGLQLYKIRRFRSERFVYPDKPVAEAIYEDAVRAGIFD